MTGQGARLYFAGALLLAGIAPAVAASIPVGQVSVQDRWKCTASSGGNVYFATANTELRAQNKLLAAGLGPQSICRIQSLRR